MQAARNAEKKHTSAEKRAQHALLEVKQLQAQVQALEQELAKNRSTVAPPTVFLNGENCLTTSGVKAHARSNASNIAGNTGSFLLL